MGASKIPDHLELQGWMREGKSNKECIAMLVEKYGLAGDDVPTTQAMSMFRARNGLEVRLNHSELLPWRVKSEHSALWIPKMLRAESRQRRGEDLPNRLALDLRNWKSRFDEGGDLHGAVVHYDRDLEEGFVYVPRREGVDTDMIRDPRLDDEGNRID